MRLVCFTAALAIVGSLGGCAPHDPVPIASDGPSLRVAHQALADGQAGTSLAIAQGVLSQQPNNVAALVQAADAQMMLSDKLGAQATYRRALSLEPHSLQAQLGLGKMQLTSDPKAAETTFRGVVRSYPRSAVALTDLGVSLDRQSRPMEAQAAYQQALLIDPNLFSAHVDLAFSLALNGQPERAEVMLRDAAESTSSTPRVRADLAVAEMVLGHKDEAVQTLRSDLTVEDTKASVDGMEILAPAKPTSH